jgi:hypothetical protein
MINVIVEHPPLSFIDNIHRAESPEQKRGVRADIRIGG